MHSIFNTPSTPTSARTPLQHRPLNSSPLAAPSLKMSSSQRRRSQYKAQIPSTPSSAGKFLSTRLSSAGNTPDDDPQKAFLRGRFKARCLERAVKARENAIRGRRAGTLSEPSSDDYPMDDDDEEDDDDIMQDELFRRIMANVNQKQKHSYKVSYAREVGSSFDPDLEDINSWEEELAGAGEHSASSSATDTGGPSNSASGSLPETSEVPWMDEEIPEEFNPDPEDLDDELEAYAEEFARRAAVADFEDIPLEDLFDWNDSEDIDTTPVRRSGPEPNDDGMDIS